MAKEIKTSEVRFLRKTAQNVDDYTHANLRPKARSQLKIDIVKPTESLLNEAR